jgi:hypothetical protein
LPYVSGIVASTALGELQGKLAVVAPSVGDQEDAINASTGAVLPGFPWFTGDGDFATPALANFNTTPNGGHPVSLTGNDLTGIGSVEIINGGGQFAGIAFGTQFTRGGHVGVLRATGIEGTDNQRGGGSVWALDAQNGHVLWHTPVPGEVMGGCVTADLGGGYQDVIVASTGGAFVLDGRTGALLATVETGVGLQNSALVTDDPDGWTGVTVAGYNGYNRGVVEHFELVGSKGYPADEPGSWPMFHRDSTLSGNANLASGSEIAPAK